MRTSDEGGAMTSDENPQKFNAVVNQTLKKKKNSNEQKKIEINQSE